MSSFFEIYEIISHSKLFDVHYYLTSNSDVASSGADAVTHYLEEGASQGRRPSARFDVVFYLQQCEAIGELPTNPLLHYLQTGKAHGLKIWPEVAQRKISSTASEALGTINAKSEPVRRPLQLGEIRIEGITLSPDGEIYLAGTTLDTSRLTLLELSLNGIILGAATLEHLSENDLSADPGSKHLAKFKYSGRIDRTSLPPQCRLNLRIVRKNGYAKNFCLRCIIKFGKINLIDRIEIDEDLRLFIDSPKPDTNSERIVVGDDLPIRGWALGKSGIEKVEILIDGKVAASTTTRIAREDVMTVHPGYKNSLRCGFDIRILRTSLPLTEHLVEVRAVDPSGVWTAIEFGVTVKGRKAGEAVLAEDATDQSIDRLEGKLIDELLARVLIILSQNSRRLVELNSQLGERASEVIKSLAVHTDQIKNVVETIAQARTSGTMSNSTLEEVASILGHQNYPLISQSTTTENINRFARLVFPVFKNPKVSILIPVFNQFYFTHECLTSILKHPPSLDYEVILVDDASTDETQQTDSIIEGVIFTRNEANSGFIFSCNRGAALARGEYLMLLNNDATLTQGAVDELLKTFENAKVGLAGSKLLFPDGRLQEAGGIIWKDGSGSNYGRGEDAQCSDYNYLRSVDYCSGASLMIRKALWDELNGFDLRYAPAYYEDTDLAFRVRQAGYDVCYQPFSTVVHREGISSGKAVDEGIKAMQPRNRDIFRARWKNVLESYSDTRKTTLLDRDRGTLKRALFIDATTPTPDQDAGSTVAVAHMQVLQMLGYKVSFLPNDQLDYDKKYTPQLQREGIEAIYYPTFNSLKELLEARGNEFDLVYVHRYTVAEEAIPLVRKFAAKAFIIFNNADLHFLRMLRELKISPSNNRFEKAMEVKTKELAVINAADCSLICNTAEQELLAREAPMAKLFYLPWVIDTRKLSEDFKQRTGFMFLGGFGHPPNVDAVKYFVTSVMPHVRKILPGASLHIYGSNVPENIKALAADDIKIEGFIANLETAFRRHKLSIAPLRFGAGFKGKVAASLAHGVPIVASTLAAEGTGLQNGKELLIADDPVIFAQAIAKIYTEKHTWSELRANGHRYVDINYSRKKAEEVFKKILS